MVLPKFSKREYLLLTATVIVVSLTIIYGFMIEPYMRANAGLSRQIEKGMLKLGKNYKLLARSDAIEAEYKKYAEVIKRLPSGEEEVAAALKAIEAAASENKIYITNIRPQAVRAREFYKELIFELIAEADIDRVVKFIYEMQTAGKLFRITKLTLSSFSAKEKGLKAIMEITKPSVSDLSL